MAAGNRSATLRDVAKVVGVSASMVSRVLNGGGRASPATRKAILDAAERLQYRPDMLGRSLASGRSLMIGILCTQSPHGFVVPILVGAHNALTGASLASFLFSVEPSTDGRSWNEGLRRFRSRRVDAVLVIGTMPDSIVPSISDALSVPVAYAFARTTDPADDVLIPDDQMAGRLATEHLVETGRRQIAHVTGPRELTAVRERANGLRQALREAGLEPALSDPLYGDWSRGWGETAADAVVEHKARIDAVFCGNDMIATGMRVALAKRGVRVPEDISLVGYDNVSRLENQPDDFLTTVDPNLPELGEAAVQHLVAALDGDIHHGVQLNPCTLVLRRSTAPHSRVGG